VTTVLKSGKLSLLEPSGPVQACNGIGFPLPTLSLPSVLDVVVGSKYVSTITPTLGKETRYPLHRRLGGPQGWSGLVLETSPPQGFDPRTAHPVANRYTDCGTEYKHNVP